MSGRRAVLVAVVAGLFGATGLAAQQFRIGAQASLAQDTDIGIGPRVEIGFVPAIPGLAVVGSFDYFFPGNLAIEGVSASSDVDYWEINANLIYGFDLPDAPGVELYFGGGLNVSRIDGRIAVGENVEEASDTNLGLNLVGGTKFPLTGITPFVELRLELKGDDPFGVEDQFVVAGGILFP